MGVAVFSAQRYVLGFLREPLQAAFSRATFIEGCLDETSAKFAAGHQAVCLFVNDDGSAAVLKVLAKMGVQFIAMRCAGFDKIDLQAAALLGLSVSRVPTYSPHSIAEHAVGLMMCLNRKYHHAHNRMQQWDYSLSGLVGFELHGKTCGVVGTGAIGTAICKTLKGFGCKVLAHDIAPSQRCIKMGVQYVEMSELLQRSDVVTLHCPLLPSTLHIIDAERISMMKPGAMLINCSRGGLVDTLSLIDALESGRIAAAGLDVYEHEGPLFFSNLGQMELDERMRCWDRSFQVLKSFPNVLITPHSAFLTHEALCSIRDTTVANLLEFQEGRPLSYQVCAEATAPNIPVPHGVNEYSRRLRV
jgi:D-lactate dehydrogenase